MKKIALLLLVTIAAGCDWMYGVTERTERNSKLPGGHNSGSSRTEASDTTHSASPHAPDTVVWACAVQVPDDYYWPRDTAMGAMGGQLLLFRNNEKVLSLPIGSAGRLSPNPASHHLREGHLYTEYAGPSGTVVMRDGEVLCSYEGREVLKGFIVKDGSFYSLGMDLDDYALVLRKEGEIMLRIAEGTVFGGIGERVPALYEDKGHICFSYHVGNTCYHVEDGTIGSPNSPGAVAEVEDFRHIDGIPYLLFRYGNKLYLRTGTVRSVLGSASDLADDFALFRAGGEIFAAGSSYQGQKPCTVIRDMEGSNAFTFEGASLFLYESGGKIFGISPERPVRLQFAPASPPATGKTLFSDDGAFFFSKGCGAAFGGSIYLGISEAGGKPYLLKDGRKIREYDINGYVSGVEVTVSLPN